jgi:hypothetical protein
VTVGQDAGVGPDEHQRRRDWLPWLAMALGLVGAGVRIVQFVGNRSLWLDEAMLANNLTSRGFGDLLRPLDENQGAPVLFLWLERAAIVVFGEHEWAMRLLPLLAGLAVLPLTYVAGRRLIGRRAGEVGLVLVALSPALVRYSSEVKQYSVDAAVTIGLLVLVLGALAGSRRELGALAVAGAAAMWLSHPAVFVLAAGGLLLLWRRRDRTILGIGALWGVSLAVEYVVTLRDIRDNDAFQIGWRHGFPDDALDTFSWLPGALTGFVHDPAGFRLTALVVLAAAVGAAILRRAAWPVVLPFALLVVAAIVKAYPFAGRVALFAVPLLLLLLASTATRTAGLLVVVLLAVPPAVTTLDRVVDPLPFPDGRGVLEHVANQQDPGDRVWLLDPALAVWQHYGPRLGVEADGLLAWRPQGACPDLPPGDVWVLHIYTFGDHEGRAGRELRAALDRVAERRNVATFTDASATRYRIDEPVQATRGDQCLELRPVPR